MTYSTVTYASQAGSITDYAFAFDYLSPSDISVTVDGVSTSFTLPTTYIARVSPAPTGTVVVARTTPITNKVTTFVDGSVQIAEQHNDQNDQLLFATQESVDTSTSAMRHNGVVFSATSKLISNVLDPVSNQDAATKAYVDSNDAATAILAQADADAAAISASSALVSKNNAATSETNSATSATNSSTSADASLASANAAALSAAAAANAAAPAEEVAVAMAIALG
tara:strand:+ start:1124 stop:1801 length:678 start_codon:yes stop_codon:yes gene_type:complete